MNFIRNNKSLVIAFILTFIIAATMIVLDFYMYSQFDSTTKEINQNAEKFDKLSKNSPKPTLRTATHLNRDYDDLARRLRNIQRQFGKYYRKPFQKFCRSLELEEEEVLTLFSQFCQELPDGKKMKYNAQTDVPNFLDFVNNKLIPLTIQKMGKKTPARKPTPDEVRKKIQEALKVFETEVDPIVPQQIVHTMLEPSKNQPGEKQEARRKRLEEEISQTNGYEYLMEAMGLPRSADFSRFSSRFKMTQKTLLDRNMIPGLDIREKYSDKEEYVKKLTFDQLPKQSRIYLLLRQMQMRYDVFRRLKKNGIQNIEDFVVTSPLEGESILDKKFIRFSMEGKFLGTLNSIRNAINDFNNAAAENVLYTIDFLELERVVQEDIDNILKEADVQFQNKAQNNQDEAEGQQPEKAAIEADVVVGKDNTIRATMKFHTVLFVGDEIARTGAEQK